MFIYIDKLLRKWEEKRLVATIVRKYPDLEKHQPHSILAHFLTQEVAAFSDIMKQYDEEKVDELPRMPPLLIRALRCWTTASATTYAFMYIQKELEIKRLNQVVEAHKLVFDEYQKRGESVLTLIDKVTKVAVAIDNTVHPENRLN